MQEKQDNRRGPKLDPAKRGLVQWWAAMMRERREKRVQALVEKIRAT